MRQVPNRPPHADEHGVQEDVDLVNHPVARAPSLKKSDQRGAFSGICKLEVPPKFCYTWVRSLQLSPQWGTLLVCLTSSP